MTESRQLPGERKSSILLLAILLFALLRPTFPELKLERVSDFLVLVLLFGALVILGPPLRLGLLLAGHAWAMVIVLSSLLMYLQYGVFVPRDLFDLYRVAVFLIALGLSKYINLKVFYRLFVLVGIVHVGVMILQVMPGPLSKLFYFLYATENIVARGSASGLFYTHSEAGLFSLLAAHSCEKLVARRGLGQSILTTLFLLASVVTWSKAAILISAIYFLGSVRVFTLAGFSRLVLLALGVVLIQDYVLESEYLVDSTVSFFMYGAEASTSYSARLDDYALVPNMQAWELVVGRGPMRALDEVGVGAEFSPSLIEVTTINQLVRWGLLGLSFYYIPMILAAITVWRQRDYRTLLFLTLVLIADSMGTFSDQPKIYPILTLFFFALWRAGTPAKESTERIYPSRHISHDSQLQRKSI